MTRQSIIVAGGGIGGLAAALGLARAGYPTVVLEKAPKFSEIGAGIQLALNAFHALDALGVGDVVRSKAVFIDCLQLMDAASGDEITRIRLDAPFRNRFGNPYAVVHRGDLYAALLNACRGQRNVELRVASEVDGYEQDGAGVLVQLASGESVVGTALIGADGLWSNIRKRLVGDGRPRISGHTTYRSVIPTEQMPEDLRWNAATLWAGAKCHIVHYPLSGWKLFNLVVTCHNDAPEPVTGKPISTDEVIRQFQYVHDRAQKIIRHGSDWRLWVLCDRDPIEKWVDGRVTLLGDAAHPMLQYFAQGACMALEDGVCLAQAMMACGGEIETALNSYQSQRVIRTARVQLQSRAIGEHIYHPSGAHAAVRNAVMRSKTSDDFYEHLAWLYGGTEQSMTASVRLSA
jgi:salicylate hydroxylase